MTKIDVPRSMPAKSRRGVIIAVIALVVLLSAGYFVYQDSGNKPSEGLFSAQTAPLNVLPKLGSDIATMAVSAKGGELKLTDGTKVTFPVKSVIGSQVVTVTKLESIGNLPAGYQLVRGIELSPATELGVAAKISLPLPAGTDTKTLVGFEYAEGGKDFFLTPVKIVGQTVELTINGFSGHGVLSVGDSSQLPPNPSTIEAQTKQGIALILLGKEEPTADDLSNISNLLAVWFDTSVKPRLEKAADADDASVDAAVHEFASWLLMIQSFELDGQLTDQENSGYELSAKALKAASDKAYASCVSDKDPVAAARLLRWFVLAELMGLDGKSDLSAQTILDNVKKCMNFELRITSEFEGPDGRKSTATGSVKLSIDDDLTISGEGKIEQAIYKFSEATQPCTISAPLIFPIKVPDIILDVYAKAQGVSLYFEIGEPENGEPSYDCPFGEGQNLTLQGLSFSWYYSFDEAHSGEHVGDSGFLFRDFEVLGSGGTYAKKTYSRTIGDQNEHTILELLHQPK